MRDVSVYEPSKSISAFEQFPYKTLFKNSEDNGLWGIKNNTCKEVSFKATNSYIGKDHLHINSKEKRLFSMMEVLLQLTGMIQKKLNNFLKMLLF